MTKILFRLIYPFGILKGLLVMYRSDPKPGSEETKPLVETLRHCKVGPLPQVERWGCDGCLSFYRCCCF